MKFSHAVDLEIKLRRNQVSGFRYLSLTSIEFAGANFFSTQRDSATQRMYKSSISLYNSKILKYTFCEACLFSLKLKAEQLKT
jgi:hypothetical protein